MPTLPSKTLETFANPEPGRDYIIEIETPEFTCLCPKTGQPDFATLTLEYVPDRLCLELKSLKLYIWSYRNEGAFHEKVTNTILNDLVAATQPRYMRLRARFNVRGGITTTVEVEYRQTGWAPAPPRPDHLPREVQKTSTVAAETRASPAPVRTAKPEPKPTPEPEPEAPRPPTPEPGPAVTPNSSTETPAPASRSERFRMLRRRRGAGASAETTPAEPAPAPPAPTAPARDVYIGIDFGTSGCRALAIDTAGNVLGQADTRLPSATRNGDQITQDPMQWWKAMTLCLQNLLAEVEPQRVQRLAVDGTSGTLLLCDKHGSPITPALMYNDRRAQAEAEAIAGVADDSSGAHGATASLAKLLWLQGKKGPQPAAHVLHQADWISNRLMGIYGHSDYNNCLKLGYDAQTGDWPSWFAELDVDTALLPKVHAPGDIIGTVSTEMAETFGLPAGTEVAAGTSDGVAAFLASGASEPGQGMTALGNSLVLKLLCTKPIFSAAHGVYSHRLGSRWLAGGASNAGGAVLLQYFSEVQLREMTPLLDPEHATDLAYYPLPDIGERFPVNNPNMEPRLEPLPGDSVMFLQGMLEGIARIEAQGYQLLTQLGAPKVKTVRTTGGGSGNPAWTRIRERALGVKITAPRSEHAAYGAALIAAGIIAKAYL